MYVEPDPAGDASYQRLYRTINNAAKRKNARADEGPDGSDDERSEIKKIDPVNSEPDSGLQPKEQSHMNKRPRRFPLLLPSSSDAGLERHRVAISDSVPVSKPPPSEKTAYDRVGVFSG